MNSLFGPQGWMSQLLSVYSLPGSPAKSEQRCDSLQVESLPHGFAFFSLGKVPRGSVTLPMVIVQSIQLLSNNVLTVTTTLLCLC